MSSANVLALIPARSGSKGIPGKNFTELAGIAPIERAYLAAFQGGIAQIVVSSDSVYAIANWSAAGSRARLLLRPPELAQDDTPMIEVVKHALAESPGPDDQIILLVQPTQPLRQPKHLTAAIELLQSSGADSVVSVVALPLAQSPDLLCEIEPSGRLAGWDHEYVGRYQPTRRQAARQAYQRDGTAYCFRRSTVTTYGDIYGHDVRPLIIPPEETCPLDTPADWAEAERRLRAL